MHEVVIAHGARPHDGALVDEVYDRGPIIAQWPVPVFPFDDAVTLARRVLAVEHALPAGWCSSWRRASSR
ncbi:MAG: hypothetical protein IPK33_11945 [Gemmatimonadetes bacterium]|nr:hypothetical protein [Gemmatimonadota bacterium]